MYVLVCVHSGRRYSVNLEDSKNHCEGRERNCEDTKDPYRSACCLQSVHTENTSNERRGQKYHVEQCEASDAFTLSK